MGRCQFIEYWGPKHTMEENLFPTYVGAQNIHLLLITISFFVCTLIIIDKQMTIHEYPLFIIVENLKLYSSE